MEERLLRIEFTVLNSTKVKNKEISVHTTDDSPQLAGICSQNHEGVI